MRKYLVFAVSLLIIDFCNGVSFSQDLVIGKVEGLIPNSDGKAVLARVPVRADADLFTLLRTPEVHSALLLSDDQVAEIDDIVSEGIASVDKRVNALLLASPEMTADDVRELVNIEMLAEVDRKVKKVILPTQWLDLVSMRSKVIFKELGASGVLSDQAIRQELGLSKEEVESLNEKAAELERELRVELVKLREKAIGELVRSLPKEKQKRAKEILAGALGENVLSAGLSNVVD